VTRPTTRVSDGRRISFLELWRPSGWVVKCYGICHRRDRPRTALIGAAKAVANERLREAGGNHYGIGFLGIHDGRDANVAFIDWWADENELHHHAFVGPTRRPETLRACGGDDLTACVWDLEVIAFERDQWLRHCLRYFPAPHFEAYLAAVLARD
jgi:hypothetical protein